MPRAKVAMHLRVETVRGELILAGTVPRPEDETPSGSESREVLVEWFDGQAAAAGAVERLSVSRAARHAGEGAASKVRLVMNVSGGVSVFSWGFC